ncbi:DUF6777 domain-containing protein [Streptomyces sp. NPDC059875]|uniref:DUF6777 domain-containing protein n=1 Tax=unclassified Streptomyces TaxID=2593676 RepID=UPI003669964D
MRSSIRGPRRPHVTALAALVSALLLAGCSSGGDSGAAGLEAASQEVFLQPVAAQGPDPFTASTAKAAAPAPTAAAPDTPPPTASAQTIREVTGSTPGLYGGTRSVASCDVERQVAFLAGDQAKAHAFAEAAGIPESALADWLRGLTPVVLSSDTRVTNHGFRDGSATAFQSVLQAGTAVLVDQYGAPRVRCACGNPLRSPVAVQGARHSGQPWRGYHRDRVVVIRPTTTVVNSLVIVNVVNNTWIERKTGTDGERDAHPVVVPPCDPAACVLTEPPAPVRSPSVTDSSPAPERSAPVRPDGSTTPGDTASPSPTDCPSLPPSETRTGTPDTASPDTTTPYPSSPSPTSPSPSIPPGCPTPTWSEPASPPTPEPPVEPEPEAPSFEDLFPSDTGAQQPETFEG